MYIFSAKVTFCLKTVLKNCYTLFTHYVIYLKIHWFRWSFTNMLSGYQPHHKKRIGQIEISKWAGGIQCYTLVVMQKTCLATNKKSLNLPLDVPGWRAKPPFAGRRDTMPGQALLFSVQLKPRFVKQYLHKISWKLHRKGHLWKMESKKVNLAFLHVVL